MMDRQKEPWTKAIKQSPFDRSHFTDELKTQVLNKTKKPSNRRFNVQLKPSMTVILGVVVLIVVGSILFNDWVPFPSTQNQVSSENNQHMEDAEVLLKIFPDPYLRAGEEFGYLFHFTAPFDELRGKFLSIRAVHNDSGLEIAVVLPFEVNEPSPGYQGLERFTAFFELPLGGLWRYEAEFDGKPYANVELTLQEPTWEESPFFTSGNYEMRGIEDRVGFIDAGFFAGKSQKYMWHFWEDNNIKSLDGSFQVKAMKQGSHEMIEIFSSESLGGTLNGARRHSPSMMSLPESGLWRLLPYVDGQMLGSIVIKVE